MCDIALMFRVSYQLLLIHCNFNHDIVEQCHSRLSKGLDSFSFKTCVDKFPYVCFCLSWILFILPCSGIGDGKSLSIFDLPKSSFSDFPSLILFRVG